MHTSATGVQEPGSHVTGKVWTWGSGTKWLPDRGRFPSSLNAGSLLVLLRGYCTSKIGGGDVTGNLWIRESTEWITMRLKATLPGGVRLSGN